ncbi:hypothetical protein [Flindersiella endophytica]
MDFAAWARALSARGLQVVPPSHQVPVVLWALLPDGGALHFQCRGTTVTLSIYAESALMLLEPESLCGCGCGMIAKAPATPPRLALRDAVGPDQTAVFDGAAERGWRTVEAGRLRVDEAAELFEQLLAKLQPVRFAAAPATAPTAAPTAPAVPAT